MGVFECDTLLMLLAASTDMQEQERNVVTRRLIEGFSDLARQAGTSVTGGQTVLNPWPIIGGVATSVCRYVLLSVRCADLRSYLAHAVIRISFYPNTLWLVMCWS